MTLIDIEQNDVDISKLFEYKKELVLKIPDTDKEITFYQRLIGDEHINKSRVYALRKSATFREKLRDLDWEDRVAYVPNIRKFKKDELVDLILALELREITIEALNSIPPLPYPAKLKGDSKLEDLEAHQKKIDGYGEKMSQKVQDAVEIRLKERKKELSKRLKDNLILAYEVTIINQHSSEEFTTSYQEMSAYYGTFLDEDHKKLAFDTFEEFKDAPILLKKALIASYVGMEIDARTLKK